MQERTVGELKKLTGGKVQGASGFSVDTVVPMAAVEMAAKTGPFFANLMGKHKYLTMDRWWTRTYNRYRGTITTAPTQTELTQALQQAAGTTAGALGTTAPQFGQVSQTALQQALSTLGQETPTAESLFAQLQATRQDPQERQRLALENRLQAQGRGGVQTAAYGGTPEALALEKAIQEQMSADLLSATTLAPQLAQQQTAQATGLFGLGAQAAQQPGALTAQNIQNISGMLTTAAQPEQQLLSALSPALQASQLAQTGRASEAQLLGALGPQMLESITETGAIEAGLEQEQINAILQGLGLQTQSSQVQQAVDLLDSLGIKV